MLFQNNINPHVLFYLTMRQSYLEIRKTSIKENISLYHPYIKFVLFHGKNCYCEKHPEKTTRNLGSFKQHIEGSDHYLNFDTGEPLDTYFENNSKALGEQSSLNENLTKLSDEYKLNKLVISSEKNPVLAWYKTYRLFEGKQRDEEMAKLAMAQLMDNQAQNILGILNSLLKHRDSMPEEDFQKLGNYFAHIFFSLITHKN